MKKPKINYNDTFGTMHSRDYYRGASFHFSGKWVSGAHYISDDYNVDFVVHGQTLLACAKSHLSSLDNEPTEFITDESGTAIGVISTYWDFVLSGIVGNSPGVKIIDNYWYICKNTGVPEEEQVWENTGVKAKMELSDLSPEEIALLQEPGKQVVTEFVNNTITQETGQNVDKIMSQKAVTDALSTKATVSQVTSAIANEVQRADLTYQPKGDYATNTRVTNVETDLNTENARAITVENDLQAQIDALATGAKVTLTASPATIYKNTNTTVTLTASTTNLSASTITIFDGDNVLITNDNVTTISTAQTVNLLTTTKQYQAKAVNGNLALFATYTINARYPIYYGFGSSYTVVSNKLSARTSALGNYPKCTATADNQHFYIIVPPDISAISQFTMGGAPYVMNMTNRTIDGISNYKVYESGAVYNTGAEVTVTAS